MQCRKCGSIKCGKCKGTGIQKIWRASFGTKSGTGNKRVAVSDEEIEKIRMYIASGPHSFFKGE